MAWSTPTTFVATNVLTAAQLNTNLNTDMALTESAIVTTAGDFIYGTGANALARLGIRAAFQQLITNSGATAPEWSTPIGWKIAESLPNNIEISFNSIPQNFRHLMIEASLSANNGATPVSPLMQVNGITNSSCLSSIESGNNATAGSNTGIGLAAMVLGFCNSKPTDTVFYSALHIIIPYYTQITNFITTLFNGGYSNGTGAGAIAVFDGSAFCALSIPAAITSLRLFTTNTVPLPLTTFANGSVADLYGLL